MSFLSQHGVSVADQRATFLKILGYGNSGDGKSTLAATMPGKVLVVACEKQGALAIRRRFVELGRDPKDLTFIFLEDKVDEKTGKVTVSWRDLLHGIVKDLSRGGHGYTSVALDSLSDLQSLIVRSRKLGRAGSGKNASEVQLTQQEWGWIIDETRDVAIRFRDLAMHTYIIALANETQGADQKMYWRPALQGKKLPGDLPQYFNLVVFPMKQKVSRGERAKFVVLTEGGEETYTKGHPALEPIEEPNISDWIDKINTHGAITGEGALSMTAGDSRPIDEKVEEEKERVKAELLADPEVKAAFDELGSTEAKRIAAVEKYSTRSDLMEVLGMRVKEHRSAAQAAEDKKRRDKAKADLLVDPEVKDLFDKLGANEQKRIAAIEKYSDRNDLLAILKARVEGAAS